MYRRKYKTHLKSIEVAAPDVHASRRDTGDQRCRKRNAGGERCVYEGRSVRGEGPQVVLRSRVLEKRPGEEGAGEREHLMELLKSYLLLAASRTIAGGDYFCVVEDLFAGRALCSVLARAAPH